MEKILNDLTALIVPLAKDLIVAVLVFFIGFKVVNIISKRIRSGKILKNVDPSAASFIASFLSISLKIIIIVTIVAILGVPMSSVVALVASAGVAIGLAVQGALSNLVGGLMILFFRPFRVGDYVDAQGASGTVRDISVFYTVLVTPDNKVITVPNGGLTNSVITNYTTKETRRVDVVFSVDYKHDSDEVKAIMLSVADSCEKALKDPAPAAIMSDCADSGITYTLRVWSNNADYWTVREELVSGVRKAFKKADIEIPYPQVDVHIKNEK